MEDLAVTIPDIRALVAERQRFDDWLTALEAKRAETPVRVFERVHADYVSRRDAVIENLHTHVGSLEALERDLDDRLQSLEARLAEREDERAEAMLRTAVGEFDTERWEATRHEVEESLAQLGQERESLISEAEDVRSLLTSARHKPAPPEPEPEPEPLVVASVPDVTQEFVSTNVAAAIAHADPAVAEHSEDLNATGNVVNAPGGASRGVGDTDPFLRAIARNAAQAAAESASEIESAFAVSNDGFENITGAREVPTYPFTADTNRDVAAAGPGTTSVYGDAARAENERDREANAALDAFGVHDGSRSSNTLDDIDVFGEPGLTSRANASAASDVVAPRSNNDPYAPRNAAPSTPATPPSAPARDAFDDLAFLRSVTESGSGSASSSPSSGAPRAGSSEQAKTLRCTECGTMNFPTEWYCERCGGELAAF